MDVKDLIKWLFQVDKSDVHSNKLNVYSLNGGRNIRVAVICAIFIVLNTGNICNCKEIILSVNTNIDNVPRSDKENKSKTLVRALSDRADSNSEAITLARSILETTNFNNNAPSSILERLSDFEKILDDALEKSIKKETARTFGRPIKKLQAMMIPLMFKLGVLSTIILLTFLLALKGVVIGKILIMLSSGTLLASLAKLFLAKGSHGHDDLGKQVHLHIHNSGSHQDGGWSSSHSYPVSSVSHSGPEAWNRRQEPFVSNNQHFFQHTGLGAAVINTPYGKYVKMGLPTAPSLQR